MRFTSFINSSQENISSTGQRAWDCIRYKEHISAAGLHCVNEIAFTAAHVQGLLGHRGDDVTPVGHKWPELPYVNIEILGDDRP